MNNNNNDNMDVAMIRKRFNNKPTIPRKESNFKDQEHSSYLVAVPFPWVSMVTAQYSERDQNVQKVKRKK